MEGGERNNTDGLTLTPTNMDAILVVESAMLDLPLMTDSVDQLQVTLICYISPS